MGGHLQKSPAVASIILAAGNSSRMRRPKALLPYRGKTFLLKLIEDFEGIGCRPILIILGKDQEKIKPILSKKSVILLHNPHPENGPLSSLQIALRSLPIECEGFFFCPVDHPAVKRETLKLLLSKWRKNPVKALRPKFGDRRGHPVIMGSNWIEEIMWLPLSSNMRELLQKRSKEVVDLAVDDPGILLNVDTPEDYARLSNVLNCET